MPLEKWLHYQQNHEEAKVKTLGYRIFASSFVVIICEDVQFPPLLCKIWRLLTLRSRKRGWQGGAAIIASVAGCEESNQPYQDVLTISILSYSTVFATMAVAFGFSVGDLLALTKVTSKVVSELKEVGSLKADLEFWSLIGIDNDTQSGEAPAKYQNLIVDLELLKTALSRLYDVEPGQHGLKHLESIRAAATACQRTLEAFLDRISKFDKTLGSWDAKEKRFRGIGRRIQFSVAFEKEVKELRTTLAGHVSTIMVLLATQIMWDSPYSSCGGIEGAEYWIEVKGIYRYCGETSDCCQSHHSPPGQDNCWEHFREYRSLERYSMLARCNWCEIRCSKRITAKER